ncbi:MAG: integral rane sensor signal transduction histidine kinase [Frankiales bacterium]|nr:integral rane sensor signal transduction histidine kinase [Frankiales bacterium]
MGTGEGTRVADSSVLRAPRTRPLWLRSLARMSRAAGLTGRWRRSLATRVTVVATTATGVVMALLMVGLFVAVTRQLGRSTDEGLTARSRDLEAALTAGRGVLATEPFAQLGQGPDAQLSPALLDEPLVPAGVTVRGSRLLDRDLHLSGRESEGLRVLARRLPDGRLLTVAVSRRSQDEAGERLLAGLSVAGPLLLLLLAGVVARSVHAALRPVEELALAADRISAAEDTGRRLPHVEGDDEVAHLWRTLDAMLARLAVAFARERAFVDDASHELRTPLAVLRGELELALSDLDDRAGVEQSLRAALGEAERLGRLAEDLLQLARERAGVVRGRDDVDLPALLGRTVDRLGPATGLALTVEGPPLHLAGDADRLERALSNLVVNAAQAGASRAVLSAAGDGAHVVLAVDDDGPGFPAGFAEVAFGRFTRADVARTSGTGAGLGLALVAAVAQAAGGTASAGRSERLGGAVVRMELPA